MEYLALHLQFCLLCSRPCGLGRHWKPCAVFSWHARLADGAASVKCEACLGSHFLWRGGL